jgi:hypothetical protein
MPAGRPTIYSARLCVPVARMLAREGKTDQQIADAFSIHVDTLYDWEKKYPDFSEAIREAKLISDAEVVDSLFKLATGYRYVEEKRIVSRKPIKDKDGKPTGEYSEAVTKIERTEREVIPNVLAQQFWLKNRRRGEWQEQPKEQPGGPGEIAQFLAHCAAQIEAEEAGKNGDGEC